jgi:GDP-D-mannose dehydratase
MIPLAAAVTGQDGTCPSGVRLADRYEVHGVRRRSSSFHTRPVDRTAPPMTT